MNCNDLARTIDHSILHPTLTDAQMEQECRVAAEAGVATVCIKPYAVRQAIEWLNGSQVKVITVVGFPHGSNVTAVKVFETEYACKEGAAEIDMVVNVGKVLSEDWAYVEADIAAVNAAATSFGAALKVIIETDFLPEDRLKVKLGEICVKLGVAFIKTSTGFGFVKGTDGKYDYTGATLHDVALLHEVCTPTTQVKASGGMRTLASAQAALDAGATRLGLSATKSIMETCSQGIDPGIEGSGY